MSTDSDGDGDGLYGPRCSICRDSGTYRSVDAAVDDGWLVVVLTVNGEDVVYERCSSHGMPPLRVVADGLAEEFEDDEEAEDA